MPLTIEIKTYARREIVDITERIDAALAGASAAVCHLYLRHTTAALTVMTWEAGVPDDIMDILHALPPTLAHRHGSREHVVAHFLSALVSPSVHVPIEKGKLALGEFQRIVLLEFEGPRTRSVEIRLLAEA